MPPLVSVIVPVYNGARYLRESLDSILAQTYRPIEILVMDDASTDSTPTIIADYGDAVRHRRQSSNRGQFDNVNDGIALARGELIAVYHADDVYLPTIVEREVAFLDRHQEAGAVFCLDIFIDGEGHEYHRLSLPDGVRPGVLQYPELVDALLRHNNTFLRTPGAMVRASSYRAAGGYRPEFGSCADFDMWVRIAQRFPIGLLDEHLYRYRHTPEQVSKQYQRLRVTENRNFEILDACLAARPEIASESARIDYDAHRAEDTLMRSASYYIRGELPEARQLLRGLSMTRLAASHRANRRRLMILLAGLRVVTRVPRSQRLADWFRTRWHDAPRRAGSARS